MEILFFAKLSKRSSKLIRMDRRGGANQPLAASHAHLDEQSVKLVSARTAAFIGQRCSRMHRQRPATFSGAAKITAMVENLAPRTGRCNAGLRATQMSASWLQYASRQVSIIQKVRKTMCRSSQSDPLSMYLRSNSTRRAISSVFGVAPRQPLTWAKPVRPGLQARR